MKRILFFAILFFPLLAFSQTRQDSVGVKTISSLTELTANIDTSYEVIFHDPSTGKISYRASVGEFLKTINALPSVIGTSQIINATIINEDISGSAAIALSKLQNLTANRLVGRDTTGTGIPESLTVGYGLRMGTDRIDIDTVSATGLVSKSRLANALDDVGAGGGTLDSVFQTQTKKRTPFFTDYYNNPVTTHAGTANGDQFRDPSNVIQYEGKYYVYASRFDSAVAAADSSHVISVFQSKSYTGPFTFVGDVLSRGASGQWDDYAIFTPKAVVRKDTIWLFYTGSEGSRWSLGASYATNPTATFTKYASNPILQNSTDEGASSVWRNFRVDAATPVQLNDGSWRFYYKGVSAITPPTVSDRYFGYATMTDAAFPVPTIGVDTFFYSDADTYNGEDPEGPTVWLEGGYFYMVYATPISTGFEIVRSVDGITNWASVEVILESTVGGAWSLGRWHGAAIYYDEATGTAPIIFFHDEAALFDVRQFAILVRDNYPIMPQVDTTLFGGGSSQWTTSGSNIYYNAGNVGINQSSPGAKLQVTQTTTGTGILLNQTSASDIAVLSVRNSGDKRINILSPSASAPAVPDIPNIQIQNASSFLFRFDLDSIFEVTSSKFRLIKPMELTKFLTIEGASPIGFSIKNTSATFQNEISVGAVGNPVIIANWDNGSQSDVSKPSWQMNMRIDLDKVLFRRASAGGSFVDELELYADSLVMNGDIRTVGGAFIDDGTTVAAPDYVFEDSYNFLPIRDYINTIKGQKHLIGARSAKELKKEIPITEEMFANREAIENNVLYIEMLLDKIESLEKRVKQIEKQ